MKLTKQVAIVTGGGRGLGRAVAIQLAGLGASVVIASRNAPELDSVALEIKRRGGHALAQTADIADPRQIQELVNATERWVGAPSIVVNNAGIIDPVGPLATSDPAAWLRALDVNIGGPFLLMRAVLPGMLARGYGRIVNIASGPGMNPAALRTAYASSKAALIMLTKSLALELEGTGVAVCAIHPGPMATRMHAEMSGKFAALGPQPGAAVAPETRDPADVAKV
ncbi:MAG: SDR family oxidoreductase, partial [Chloroflexi bacterium]|nr:SDR family oxidoreductase [Chloroflexota bacterium]